MTQKTNVGLVSWAKSLLGQPYWYGTCSYKATGSLLKRKAEQYPSHYAESRMGRYRQDIRNGATVQDCVGLIKGYYWTQDDGTQIYGLDGRPDKGANGMFTAATQKGIIASMPEVIGLIVHLKGHVGVYIGDGWVIEARGFNYGVVRTRMKDRPWTSWFQCPYIEYIDGALDETLPIGNEEIPVSFNRELSYTPGKTMFQGSDVEQVQEILAEVGFDPGKVDGIYGPKTKGAVLAFQNDVMLAGTGIVNRATWDALLDVQALEDAVDPAVYDTQIDPNDTDPEDKKDDLEETALEIERGTRLLKYNPSIPMIKGSDVRTVQEALSKHMYELGKVDGVYGPKPEAAVRSFQKSVGIQVDGIVGAVTWRYLLGEASVKS